MLTSDLISETQTSITANKARSFLTVLGIVIGISSVIAMIAIGQGTQKSIQESIQSIGANLLMVRPGAQKGPGQTVNQGAGSAATLTLADAQAIEKEIKNIQAIAPTIDSKQQVIANGQNTRTSITGTLPTYAQVRNLEIEYGSFLTDNHQTKKAKVAVLGPDTKNELFGEASELTQVIGKKIRIGSADFTVIGITKSKGGSGFGSEDDVIYIPLSAAMQYFTGSDALSMINIATIDQESMTSVEQDIMVLLLKLHKIEKEGEADFRIMNQADIVETASSVTGALTALLGAVAGISLVVGGIGIMNMMLTSVTERTREIGLRKAIGAKRADISAQFLIEAVTLTVIGGILGILLGIGIAWGVNNYAGIAAEVSSASILLSVGVSAFVGIVFGYYPAQRAAKLNPIEALRYE